MFNTFRIGDWANDYNGVRVLIAGHRSNGLVICEYQGGTIIAFNPNDLTPLTGCTGWDWQPAPAAAPADVPGDVAYVVLQVKRAVWDGLQIGEQVPADAVYSANEAMPVVAMCGATMLLLPD